MIHSAKSRCSCAAGLRHPVAAQQNRKEIGRKRQEETEKLGFVLQNVYVMINPPQSASPVQRRHTSQFVGFELAGQAYAFRIDQIQEIVILNQVTRTPQVPDFVEGVANLRGSIIPIINLRRLFRLPAKENDGDTRTIVVNVGERTMGCTVDLVSQVIRIPEESIQAAPETVTSSSTTTSRALPGSTANS